MSISVLGIDIDKNNFYLFGVDADGKKVFRKKLTREKLIEFIPTLELCLIVMEACGGAHYWARYFQSCDHQVKLIAPQYVKMYVKTNTYAYQIAPATTG